jgi:hypothetical protein
VLIALIVLPAVAADPYTPSRGVNTPSGAVVKDTFGNAAGSQHDLVVDGAFGGQTVAVLQFFPNLDFSYSKDALAEKGFSVVRWTAAPPPSELASALERSCELWVIGDGTRHLTPEHVAVVRAFWEAGHGVFLWGDNAPLYEDTNLLGQALFGGEMLGDTRGDQIVTVHRTLDGPGVKLGHDITTGIERLYEGITIATIQPNDALEPLVVGSAGNVVAAVYDHDGRRAIIDGGFTRLYGKWDTAGTARYVKNAAAWLANYERFGEAVVPER